MRAMSTTANKTLRRTRSGSGHLSFLRSGGRETPCGFLPRDFVRGVGSPRGEVGPVSRPLTTPRPPSLAGVRRTTSQWYYVFRRVMGSCYPVWSGGPKHSPAAARAIQRSTSGPPKAGLAPDVSRLPRRHPGEREGEGSMVWLQRGRSEGKCSRERRVTWLAPRRLSI